VLERTEGVVPALAEIEPQVRADWERAVATERAGERIDALTASYDVTVVRP